MAEKNFGGGVMDEGKKAMDKAAHGRPWPNMDEDLKKIGEIGRGASPEKAVPFKVHRWLKNPPGAGTLCGDCGAGFTGIVGVMDCVPFQGSKTAAFDLDRLACVTRFDLNPHVGEAGMEASPTGEWIRLADAMRATVPFQAEDAAKILHRWSTDGIGPATVCEVCGEPWMGIRPYCPGPAPATNINHAATMNINQPLDSDKLARAVWEDGKATSAPYFFGSKEKTPMTSEGIEISLQFGEQGTGAANPETGCVSNEEQRLREVERCLANDASRRKKIGEQQAAIQLRDQFAMAALTGLLASCDGPAWGRNKFPLGDTAYEYADQMLKAREK